MYGQRGESVYSVWKEVCDTLSTSSTRIAKELEPTTSAPRLVKSVNTTRRSEFAILQCGLVPILLLLLLLLLLLTAPPTAPESFIRHGV